MFIYKQEAQVPYSHLNITDFTLTSYQNSSYLLFNPILE